MQHAKKIGNHKFFEHSVSVFQGNFGPTHTRKLCGEGGGWGEGGVGPHNCY